MCAGLFLLISVAGAMLISRAFSGSAFSIFSPSSGGGWPLILIGIYTVLACASGPTAMVLLGYQQVDWFILLLSIFLAYVFGWILFGVANSLSQKVYMKKVGH